jgi:hypothetical protein
VFDSLVSWTESDVEGVRFYSGTAIYRRQFVLKKELLRTGHLELDLGRVEVVAEVFLNGEHLGVLWKAPFSIELGSAARPGVNDLEVRVTNLWPNRLIGDECLPADYERDGALVRRWPAWLVNGEARPSERVTFTTWKHWNADSPLLPSGLLGPVVVRPYAHVYVK